MAVGSTAIPDRSRGHLWSRDVPHTTEWPVPSDDHSGYRTTVRRSVLPSTSEPMGGAVQAIDGTPPACRDEDSARWWISLWCRGAPPFPLGEGCQSGLRQG